MTQPNDDSGDMLELVREGDPRALAAFFSEYRERLRKMVEFRLDARLRGRVSASDVLQEAYIDALKRLPHFQAEPDVPLFIWLRTVTMQRLIDVHRQHLGAQARDAGREVSLDRAGTTGASADQMAGLLGDITSPSQAAHRDEMVGRLREVLERLDPIDREVLALRHFEELSNREVAEILGIQAAAASKRHIRALQRLKDVMDGAAGLGEGPAMSDETTSGDRVARTVTLSDGGSDPLDLLAEEFAERCRRGESPSIGEYEARDPGRAAEIRNLLAAVAMIEQWKRRAQQPSGDGAARPAPERFGEFRVVRELGRGGMGVVYEAVQESLGRHVALKVIHHVHMDAKRLQRFRREALAVAQLHHTHIVPIFGVGEHDGLPFYVMQLIPGRSLDHLLDAWREEGLPRRDDHRRFVARIGIQAAGAIQYAHEKGVLHRDLKPANFLIDPQDTAWVTDFGLAKLAGQDDLTASGDVVGTLRYLAPEALRGETDRRSDIYSLGLTLYELITLNSPFGGLSPSELLRTVSEGQPLQPRKLDPAIPRDLETIILKATAREPAHRYPTAAALADDLRCFLDDRPIAARRATAFERAWRWSRRNRLLAALAATAAASLLLATAVGWAGYAATARALRQSDANVTLSLRALEELFDTLAEHETLPPPPLGRTARSAPTHRGAGPGPPGHREGDGPPPPEPGRRPRDGPPGRDATGRDTALLRSVLTFYDRFARQNATDAKLQGEAAWAYRKVGVLADQLGEAGEAEVAYGRAIQIFEDLVARFPADRTYRSRLVDTYDMAEPWTADPAILETLRRRLMRALTLADQLCAESPADKAPALARVHVVAKLGVTQQRLGKTADAEATYRRAIALEDELVRRMPGILRPRLDRAITQEALAKLLLQDGQRAAARAALDAAAADLIALAESDRKPSPPPERFASLAESYRKLGEPGRADEIAGRAHPVDRGRPPTAEPAGRGPDRGAPP